MLITSLRPFSIRFRRYLNPAVRDVLLLLSLHRIRRNETCVSLDDQLLSHAKGNTDWISTSVEFLSAIMNLRDPSFRFWWHLYWCSESQRRTVCLDWTTVRTLLWFLLAHMLLKRGTCVYLSAQTIGKCNVKFPNLFSHGRSLWHLISEVPSPQGLTSIV